jgi:Zn-dependent alcohol dehydrogenase
LERYSDRYPFEDFVSHEYALQDVDTAMQMSMSPQSLKVVMNPGLT